MFILLTFILSCSGHQHARFSSRRKPASYEGDCNKALFNILNRSKSRISDEPVSYALEKEVVKTYELEEVLQSPYWRKNIFNKEDESLHEKSALIIKLIKKENPSLEDGQVLNRYHKLFRTCGL